MLQRARELVAAELDAAGQHLRHQRRRAAERHMLHLDAAVAFKHLAHQVHDAAGAGRAVVQLVLGLLRPGHELLEVVGRHRDAPAARTAHRRRPRSARSPPRCRDAILGKLIGRGRGGEGDVVEQQRMAVGRRLRDLIGAERAAGAADILDQHGLAEVSVMRCANSRASMSVVAPAGNGTMMRTLGRNLSGSPPAPWPAPQRSAAAIPRSWRRAIICLSSDRHLCASRRSLWFHRCRCAS